MTPQKTVRINLPEKTFYLHQADNELNLPSLFLLNTFFFFWFYSNWVTAQRVYIMCSSGGAD